MPAAAHDTIFVQIAAYRDPELADTVRSALGAAAHPERLRFGICHQFDDITGGLLKVAAARQLKQADAISGFRLARLPAGAAEPVLLTVRVHHRDRRLGRDALGLYFLPASAVAPFDPERSACRVPAGTSHQSPAA